MDNKELKIEIPKDKLNVNFGAERVVGKDHASLENLDYEKSGHKGFQKAITENNKLLSDLVDDNNQTNKFVTTTEKTTWNNKSDFSGSYNDLEDKPEEVTESTVSGWGFTKNTGTYTKPIGGIPKTDMSSEVQSSLEKADTAIQQHQDISMKQNIEDNSLNTNNKTIPTAINEVNSIAKGANQALSYGNYSTMVTAFNALDDDVYNVGQNVMIVTLEVPNLWISGIESISVPYTYVDDETIVSALQTDGYIQVGYYRLSMLETQKVDLTNYVTNTDYAQGMTAGVIKVDTAVGTYQNNGLLAATTKTYSQYQALYNDLLIGKGTLENVITGKDLTTKAYVDGLVGNLEDILEELDIGGGVE